MRRQGIRSSFPASMRTSAAPWSGPRSERGWHHWTPLSRTAGDTSVKGDPTQQRVREEAPPSWRPIDWWTFEAMANGSSADRTELTTAGSPRARRAWRAHHHVEAVLASGGPAAALVVVDLVMEGPPSDASDAMFEGPLTALLRRHGEPLIREVIALVTPLLRDAACVPRREPSPGASQHRHGQPDHNA
jgi:hypothetical protein